MKTTEEERREIALKLKRELEENTKHRVNLLRKILLEWNWIMSDDNIEDLVVIFEEFQESLEKY